MAAGVGGRWSGRQQESPGMGGKKTGGRRSRRQREWEAMGESGSMRGGSESKKRERSGSGNVGTAGAGMWGQWEQEGSVSKS